MEKKLQRDIRRNRIKGVFESLKALIKKLVRITNNNKLLFIVLLIYIGSLLSIIKWGLPNNYHPFNYYMDEWHQMSSVRALFKYGSSNVPGAANGTIFHFLVSGILLVPFYLLQLINPFVIKSAFVAMDMQERLFILLRLNTLFFGVLSAVSVAYIAKKYFRSSSLLAAFLLLFNPIWIYQSNFFKYDIALAFWLLIALIFLLRFSKVPNLKNYLIAGLFSALTLATKVSAIVMFPVYILAYFYFMPRNKQQISHVLYGVLIFVCIVCIFGIPDLILQRGNIEEYLVSNIINSPKVYDNYDLHNQVWWILLFTKILPLNFGYVFFAFTLLSLFGLTFIAVKDVIQKVNSQFKDIFFVIIIIGFFAASLVTLNLGASGNRIIVLVPLMAIISSFFLTKLVNMIPRTYRFYTILFIAICLYIQFIQSFIMVYAKWLPDTRVEASEWITKNIERKSVIGIENIPIYQMLPDIALKEYYTKQADPDYFANYTYEVINQHQNYYPKYIIITNKEFEMSTLKQSEKKSLVEKIEKLGYKVRKEFKPAPILYRTMGSEREFFMTVLVISPTIAIYERE